MYYREMDSRSLGYYYFPYGNIQFIDTFMLRRVLTPKMKLNHKKAKLFEIIYIYALRIRLKGQFIDMTIHRHDNS